MSDEAIISNACRRRATRTDCWGRRALRHRCLRRGRGGLFRREQSPECGAEDGTQLNQVANGPGITGQTWRVNRFVPPTALSAGRRA